MFGLVIGRQSLSETTLQQGNFRGMVHKDASIIFKALSQDCVYLDWMLLSYSKLCLKIVLFRFIQIGCFYHIRSSVSRLCCLGLSRLDASVTFKALFQGCVVQVYLGRMLLSYSKLCFKVVLFMFIQIGCFYHIRSIVSRLRCLGLSRLDASIIFKALSQDCVVQVYLDWMLLSHLKLCFKVVLFRFIQIGCFYHIRSSVSRLCCLGLSRQDASIIFEALSQGCVVQVYLDWMLLSYSKLCLKAVFLHQHISPFISK